MPSHAYLPRAFAQTVADAVPGMLAHQQPDGCLRYAPDAPIVYPQQAIFPLAFCYAGLDPERKHTGDAKLLDAIRRLGAFLEATYNQQGEFEYDSYGIKVKGVDQRLTYAWVEALRILREVGADCAYDAWSAKILRACETLIEHRLAKLVGLTRFVGRVTGTSINHVSLYLTTLYRAGTVLGRKDLADLALPMARALAADVHPDGYWEEHGDLLRNGGPTPSYNYLTHCAIGLFRAWTGEDVFLRALERSTRFHGNFSYPDASFFELIDERVRHGKGPRVWGLFGFSHWDFGRGMARAKFEGWRAGEGDLAATSPEMLARMCENFLYWQPGPEAPAPFARADHAARLALPGGLFRAGAWALGLSAMHATNAEDPAYRENRFALEKQKLFSVWHPKTGLLLDGSHAKGQPENSTFSANAAYGLDYYPCGGEIGARDGGFFARAAYKSFYGNVDLRPVRDGELRIELKVEPAGNRGSFRAGFTLCVLGEELVTRAGRRVKLGDEPFELAGAELGGGFRLGPLALEGPPGMSVHWPYKPFNSYHAEGLCTRGAWLLRVAVELPFERPAAGFTLRVE